jgi:hypothetical protein
MLIRQHQPVTRAQLARLTGLGSGPITQVTRDLLLAGLVREGARLKGGRGQPALPLMLDPSGTLSFGVGMIPGRLRIVAIDFAGGVIDEEFAPASSDGPASIVATVRNSMERMCRKARLIEPDRILGVGFAVPGFFLADHAHVRTVEEHATWRAENLEAFFSRELGHPCWVENDATAAQFFAQLDSAILMRNASTQFADGGEFGMGAEIGIATGKLHARGPVGAEQLTSFKYLVTGDGTIRA